MRRVLPPRGVIVATLTLAFLLTVPVAARGQAAARIASAARIVSAARIASAAITPASATVGDRLTLAIVVEHDDAVAVEGPGFGGDFGGLEVVDIPPPREEDLPGGKRTTLTYTLTAFKTGDALVPPLTVTLRDTDGSGVALTTDPLRVSIRSVLAPGDTSLRPLKPQLELGDTAPSPAVPALVVAVFAVLTAFGYVLFRRAAQSRPPHPTAASIPHAVPLPPEVEARAALDAIASSGLASSDPPEFYARVAAVVRRYLSDRFAFPAYAMTRRELERHMRDAEIDRWVGRVTGNLLEEADGAQFAGVVPAPERRDADLTAAYEIVAITTNAPDDNSEM